MKLKDLAREVAEYAHKGQYRRDGITPYIEHPAKVALRVKEQGEEAIACAYLHDVIEDTTITEKMLRLTFPDSVVDAVVVMTKKKGVSYEAYLAGVKANPIARKVKIADMLANLADAPTDKQIVKYAKGLLYLMEDTNA